MITKTSNDLLTDLLLEYSWDEMPQEYNIAKILLTLDKGIFIDEVKSIGHDSEFKEAALKWIESLGDVQLGEGMVCICLDILRDNNYQGLVHNWILLKEKNEQDLIGQWAFGTHCHISKTLVNSTRIIKAVHKIGDLVIVERGDGSFKHDSYVFDSLDKAIIRAIAFKYDGANSKADDYFCKMLGIK